MIGNYFVLRWGGLSSMAKPKNLVKDNHEKGLNYKRLFEKLKKANEKEFYFEGSMIAYAILEDRSRSAVEYAGIKLKNNDLFHRFEAIEKMILNKKSSVIMKAYDPLVLAQIQEFRVSRNSYVHHLPNLQYNSKEISDIALQ